LGRTLDHAFGFSCLLGEVVQRESRNSGHIGRDDIWAGSPSNGASGQQPFTRKGALSLALR
jgi:hypothetical protein